MDLVQHHSPPANAIEEACRVDHLKAMVRQIAVEVDSVRQTPREDGLADAPDPSQPDDGASLPCVLDALLPVGTVDHTQRR